VKPSQTSTFSDERYSKKVNRQNKKYKTVQFPAKGKDNPKFATNPRMEIKVKILNGIKSTKN